MSGRKSYLGGCQIRDQRQLTTLPHPRRLNPLPHCWGLGEWLTFLIDKVESGGSVVKESACNAGDAGSLPGSGRSPGEGNVIPFQYSCLGNLVNRGTGQATVHEIAKESDTT